MGFRVTGNILALDLATDCGWAAGRPDDAHPRFGTHVLPRTGNDVGAYALAFDEWLAAMLVTEQPQIVIYEQPSIFRKTTPATVIRLNGLAYHTEMVCKRQSIACFSVNPSSLKRWFSGSGKADKPMMVRAARRAGWQVGDHNQADACAVWAWAIHCFAPQHDRFKLGALGAGKIRPAKPARVSWDEMWSRPFDYSKMGGAE